MLNITRHVRVKRRYDITKSDYRRQARNRHQNGSQQAKPVQGTWGEQPRRTAAEPVPSAEETDHQQTRSGTESRAICVTDNPTNVASVQNGSEPD